VSVALLLAFVLALPDAPLARCAAPCYDAGLGSTTRCEPVKPGDDPTLERRTERGVDPRRAADCPFRGPVFVVGMPRSGTKLMRALLNQHPDLSLTLAETQFIPYFVRRFGNPPPFSRGRGLDRFVALFLETPFLRRMRAGGRAFDREHQEAFLRAVDPTSWQSIFETLLRRFGAKPDRPDAVWGDKSPSYVHHLPLLRDVFPGARFVHLIRDPRDTCLSVRVSSGKSLYGSAERWRQAVLQGCRDGRAAADYLEVRYERLLADPNAAMRDVMSFLGCAYSPRMLELQTSQEDVGDARGRRGIVRDNTGKYRSRLLPEEVRRIEEIVCDAARTLDYAMENDVRHVPLGPLHRLALRLHDGYVSLREQVRAQGKVTLGTRMFLANYMRRRCL
jgi:hypothetical protein